MTEVQVWIVTDERGTFYAQYDDRATAEQVRASIQRTYPQRQMRVATPAGQRRTPPTGPTPPIPPRW
jgi:hypothetical protein